MACPAEITLKDHSGKYSLNKKLSDETDPVFALQGIGYLTRKAIAWASVTAHVHQYAESGVTHIDIDQTATGGIKGTREERTLNWTPKTHSDHLFGDLVGKSRWTGPGCEGWDALDSYLKEGWLEGDEEKGGPNGELHIQNYVVNAKGGWTGEQIWGFALIDGVRHYTRRIVVIKGDTTMRVRMIYDWQGKD